jgi:hypothetical protein
MLDMCVAKKEKIDWKFQQMPRCSPTVLVKAFLKKTWRVIIALRKAQKEQKNP